MGGDGFAEQEALPLVRAQPEGRIGLRVILYAFGGNAQIQAFAETENCPQENITLAAFAEFFDETLVDLELVEPQLVQVREAEIGRARVGKECRSRWSPYH